jgi:hypothetical protein
MVRWSWSCISTGGKYIYTRYESQKGEVSVRPLSCYFPLRDRFTKHKNLMVNRAVESDNQRASYLELLTANFDEISLCWGGI